MQNNKRTFKDTIRLFLNGLTIGSADVIPGVSGGTMAFILGIYDELIDSIRAAIPFLKSFFTLQFKKAFTEFPFRFLIPVFAGIFIAILSLAHFLEWALENYPTYVFSLFFGLIIASLYVVRKRVSKWSVPNIIALLVAVAGAYLLVGLTPTNTPEDLWFIFLSGAVAICAMILPGISGAFILVLLGKYEYILGALLAFNLPVVVVFMLGAATGIISFSNLLRWLLDHRHDVTISILVGFMLGSLRKIWPWKEYQTVTEHFVKETNVLPTALTTEFLIAIAIMVIGFFLVFAIELLAERKNKKF